MVVVVGTVEVVADIAEVVLEQKEALDGIAPGSAAAAAVVVVVVGK